MNDILSIKKEYLLTGRGAAGIYLIVKTRGLKKVIAPSDLCYAALYPVIFAGGEIRLTDTDTASGNMRFEDFLACYEKEKDADAVIVPHMYGNPCDDIIEISRYCKENNIILIEDCASAMGAKVYDGEGDYVPAGSFGDYVIYSTGYAKTLDLGRGGIVASDHSLEEMRRLNKELPVFNERIEKDEAFFSRLYRMLRNDRELSFRDDIYRALRDNTQAMFLYRADDAYEGELKKSLEKLPQVIAERKRKLKLYNDNINYEKNLFSYIYPYGSVPWRFNILFDAIVDPSIKRKFIDRLLKAGVPVSDWYPDVSEMFGIKEKHEGTGIMEKMILNFPLTVDDEEIIEITKIINKEAMNIYGN